MHFEGLSRIQVEEDFHLVEEFVVVLGFDKVKSVFIDDLDHHIIFPLVPGLSRNVVENLLTEFAGKGWFIEAGGLTV